MLPVDPFLKEGDFLKRLKSIPCLVFENVNESILEMQLRSDCLKELLTTYDLDKAIYRYYVQYIKKCTETETSFENLTDRTYCEEIGRCLGKSWKRIEIAIDRFEFKEENQDLVTTLKEKDEESGGHNMVDSTIAMTASIKTTDKDKKNYVKKIRAEVVKNAVSAKKDTGANKLTNDEVKDVITKVNNTIKKGGEVNVKALFTDKVKDSVRKRATILNDFRAEQDKNLRDTAIKEGRATKGKLQLTMEELSYLNELERIIGFLPKKPPTDWSAEGFARAKAYVEIIINRMEVFVK